MNLYQNFQYKTHDINHDFEFFVLPTFSYFGDYQILYNLRSQITYKADQSSLLICLCISSETLLQLMANYTDARAYYMQRSWTRRKEFRRRQKKFQITIKEKIESYLNNSDDDEIADIFDDEDQTIKRSHVDEQLDDVQDVDPDIDIIIRE